MFVKIPKLSPIQGNQTKNPKIPPPQPIVKTSMNQNNPTHEPQIQPIMIITENKDTCKRQNIGGKNQRKEKKRGKFLQLC